MTICADVPWQTEEGALVRSCGFNVWLNGNFDKLSYKKKNFENGTTNS